MSLISIAMLLTFVQWMEYVFYHINITATAGLPRLLQRNDGKDGVRYYVVLLFSKSCMHKADGQ